MERNIPVSGTRPSGAGLVSLSPLSRGDREQRKYTASSSSASWFSFKATFSFLFMRLSADQSLSLSLSHTQINVDKLATRRDDVSTRGRPLENDRKQGPVMCSLDHISKSGLV